MIKLSHPKLGLSVWLRKNRGLHMCKTLSPALPYACWCLLLKSHPCIIGDSTNNTCLNDFPGWAPHTESWGVTERQLVLSSKWRYMGFTGLSGCPKSTKHWYCQMLPTTSDQELYPTCGKVCALSKPSRPNVSAHLGLSNSLMLPLPSLAEPGLGSCSRFKLASEFDVSGWSWRWCPQIRVHCEDALLLYLMKSVGSPSVISIKAVCSYSW